MDIDRVSYKWAYMRVSRLFFEAHIQDMNISTQKFAHVHIYMHIHMHVRMHACTHVRMYACTYARTHKYKHVRVYVCMYECMYV